MELNGRAPAPPPLLSSPPQGCPGRLGPAVLTPPARDPCPALPPSEPARYLGLLGGRLEEWVGHPRLGGTEPGAPAPVHLPVWPGELPGCHQPARPGQLLGSDSNQLFPWISE